MDGSKRILFVVFVFVVACFVGGKFQETEEAFGSHYRNSKKPLILKYNQDDFEKNVRSHIHIILFHKSKCAGCVDILDFLEKLTESIEEQQNSQSIVVSTIECDTVATSLCVELDFDELPTLAIFKKNKTPYATFSGSDLIRSQIKNLIHDGTSLLTEEEESEKDDDDDENDRAVAHLDDWNFDQSILVGRHFVKFYAPWCGHCQQLAPTWQELARSLSGSHFVSLSKVDCTTSVRTCSDYRITSYPTLVYFKDGQQVSTYQGPRDYSSLKKFIASMKPHHSLRSLVEATADNFNSSISSGAAIVRFYDDGCPNCQSSLAHWHHLVDDVIDQGLEIKMAEINCRKNQAKCYEQYVNAVPAIAYYVDSVRVDLFRGSHTSLSDLRLFLANLKDKKPYQLPPPHLNYVMELKMESFKLIVESNEFVFVKFYVPWCEFCKALTSIWNELAQKMHGKEGIVVAEVNCSEQNDLCRENKIRGYPTMLLYANGKMADMYTGAHDYSSLGDYLLSMAGTKGLKAKDEL